MESVQQEVDALPSRPTPADPLIDATIETYTVTHDREGTPQRAILACLDRRRHSRIGPRRVRRDELEQLLTEDCCGTPYAETGGARDRRRGSRRR